MRQLLTLTALLVFAAAVSAQSESIAAGTSNDNFLILSTKRIATMEKELADTGAKGFRVLYGAPTTQVDMALFLKKGESPVDYKILATSRISTREKELNYAGREGFRLLPRTIIFKTGLVTSELVMVMQRDRSEKSAYAYDLVEAAKEVNLQKKIDDAGTRGFVPVTMITLGKHVVVTEKVAALQ
ncbi:hypothetical protein BH20ACI2_BH20ACI2_01050 [soil metagenome]